MLLKDGTTSKNMLPRGLTSLLDSGKNKASSAAGPAAAAAAAAAPAGAGAAGFQNVPFATLKHHATEGRNDFQNHAARRHPSPHRNTMLLKDGTTSKNMLPRGLTSLLDSGKNKASSAAGPAAAAAAAAVAGAAGFQNVPFATPKHHATEGRNDLQNHASPRHPSPHRNTMLLKDGTTSKNMLPRGLTSLLDSG